APGAITISEVSVHGATVNWGPSNDPDAGDVVTYSAEYELTRTPRWSSPESTTTTSKIFTSLSAHTTYDVQVAAADNRGGVSDWTTWLAAFTTSNSIPTVPD